MRLAQALQLKKADTVVSPYDSPAFQPRKITQVWANASETIVRMRIAKVSPDWISPEKWMPAPPDAHWDSRTGVWRDQNANPVTVRLERDEDPNAAQD